MAQDKRAEWAEGSSSCVSQLLFSYIDPLLALGASCTDVSLSARELPRVSEKESIRSLLQIFEDESSVLSVGKSSMVKAGFWQALTSTGQVAEPLLVRALVLSAGTPGREGLIQGLVVATMITINSFTKAFAQQRQLHLATRCGMRVRAAAIAAIYATVLDGGDEGSSSSASTLAAVDANKLFECCLDLHLLWSAPCQIIVICGLLVYFVGGLAALAGTVTLLLTLPFVKYCMYHLIRIRKLRAPITDARVSEISEVVAGIRVTKFSGWEELWEARWRDTRKAELHYTQLEMFWFSMSLLSVVMAPVAATIATVAVHQLTDSDARISPADAFTIVSLIAAVRFPINKLGTLIGQVAQAWRALDRISRFIHQSELEESDDNNKRQRQQPKKEDDDDAIIKVQQGAFVRGKNEFVAGRTSRLELELKRGQVAVVIGSVGAGKSTLIEGLLGLVDPVDSKVNVRVERGRQIAFASQHPCVLNASLRENIVFGREFDAEQYDLALRASQLVDDIDDFPAGDLTEIGERGVTLSGGQKARVALARVVFSRPDLALLDDCFSALDAKTARRAFECLFGSEGALSRAAVVFVTHAIHLAPRDATVIAVEDGEIVYSGSWSEAPKELIDRDEVEDDQTENTGVETKTIRKVRSDAMLKQAASASLITAERRERGKASWSTWRTWCRAAGGSTFLGVQFVALFCDRILYVATEYWLARYADAREDGTSFFGKEFPSQREGKRAAWRWMRVYMCLGALSTVFTYFRTRWGFYCGVKAAKRLYDEACTRVLSAPVSYFDETPTGRIVSRFSFDTEQLDIVLTQKAAMWIISVGWAVTGAVIMLALTRGAMAVVLVPVAVVFYRLQDYYRQSAIDLQRLDAVSRSPLQQLLVEAIDASPTIRAFGVQRRFEERFYERLDANTEALLCWTAAQRWIGLRLDLLAATVAAFAAFLIATLRRFLGLSEAFSGMLMMWSLQLTITLTYLITTTSESENAVTSVERITEPVPNEFVSREDEAIIPEEWPRYGGIVFDDVCLRYREGLPLALDHLSFRIAPASRCGIVGRSGAGKSSILVGLFRLSPLQGTGDVRVDGVPLSQVNLRKVRRRVGTVIAQDPVLFSGVLRRTLDPFNLHSDEDVSRALDLVMPSTEKRMTLTSRVETNGTNFSVGERQLLALARALLEKPRILVLDEASSSLDDATDNRIQTILRELPELKETTVLCVAHRLRTIIDFDLVAVMHQGKCVEIDSPDALLARKNGGGYFRALVDATGPQAAASLVAKAAAAASQKKLTR